MIRLNLPAYEYSLQEREGLGYIYDELRRRWVRLLPEEWVRQHFVHYLINVLGYPAMLMMNEVELKLSAGVHRRADTIVYGKNMSPLVLIEYKAPNITLSEKSVAQIVRYNHVCQVPFLLLSNGLSHLACHIDYEEDKVTWLKEIPHYKQLTQK